MESIQTVAETWIVEHLRSETLSEAEKTSRIMDFFNIKWEEARRSAHDSILVIIEDPFLWEREKISRILEVAHYWSYETEWDWPF